MDESANSLAWRLDGNVLDKSDAEFPHPGVLQVGKRRFVRVK